MRNAPVSNKSVTIFQNFKAGFVLGSRATLNRYTPTLVNQRGKMFDSDLFIPTPKNSQQSPPHQLYTSEDPRCARYASEEVNGGVLLLWETLLPYLFVYKSQNFVPIVHLGESACGLHTNRVDVCLVACASTVQ